MNRMLNGWRAIVPDARPRVNDAGAASRQMGGHLPGKSFMRSRHSLGSCASGAAFPSRRAPFFQITSFHSRRAAQMTSPTSNLFAVLVMPRRLNLVLTTDSTTNRHKNLKVLNRPLRAFQKPEAKLTHFQQPCHKCPKSVTVTHQPPRQNVSQKSP